MTQIAFIRDRLQVGAPAVRSTLRATLFMGTCRLAARAPNFGGDVLPEHLPSPSHRPINAIWIDVDALRDDSRDNLLRLCYAMPHLLVRVFGVSGVIAPWRAACSGRSRTHVFQTEVAATGATVVSLVAKAVLAAQHCPDQRWVIVGAARSYLALTHLLADFGVEAERHAALTGDVLGALIDNRELMAASLRSLYVEMREGKSHRVHIGALANEAVRRWPDLEDLNVRTRLFGTRRFTPLFKAVGLVIDGDDVVGV